MKSIHAIAFMFLLGLWSTIASAHDTRPLYIRIIERAPCQYDIQSVVPVSVTRNNIPWLEFPDHMVLDSSSMVVLERGNGIRVSYNIACAFNGLKGSLINVVYPLFNPAITTICIVEFVDGSEFHQIIGPDRNEIIIPKDLDRATIAGDYTLLGIEHIWAGIDHLFFVGCLLWIAGMGRKLLWTITGFTIAHSITLVLTSLGYIDLPIPPIEATIALSILFLCFEIIHHHRDRSSLTYRYPVLVSSSFGLLHGMGFASVLGSIGIPSTHKLTALLFFNIGVEIGQLLFIIVLGVVVWMVTLSFKEIGWRQNWLIWQTRLMYVTVYGIGILSSYWMFDRLIG